MGAEPNPPESVQSLRRSSLRFCLRSVTHSHSNREQQGDGVRGLRPSQYKPHSTEMGFLECSHLQRRPQGQQSKSGVAPGHPNESEKEGVEDECVKPSWRRQQSYDHRHGDGRSPKEILYRDRCKERLVEETGEANEKPRLRQRRSKGVLQNQRQGVGAK